MVVRAAELDVVLRSSAGQPVADAVVTFTPAHGAPAGPIRFPWSDVMAQQDIAFVPHVLIVPVGASVSFPNKDKVRHDVYSFSRAKRFELKLYGHQDTRSVQFDKPGVVALGCNIHDRMSGYIVVVATPFAAKSDAAGHVALTGVPDGAGVLSVWQENQKAPDGTISQPLALHGDTRQALTLDLRPAALSMPH